MTSPSERQDRAVHQGKSTEAPPTFNGDLRNLPDGLAALTALPNWVIWRWGTVNGKNTKVPYQPRRPASKAKNNDPKTWDKYETALRAFEAGSADGIGFCLLHSGFAAFDLDHCRDPATGSIDAWAQDLVDRVGSYTEITVSGTGLRIIGRGTGPKVHRKQRTDGEGSLETYRQAERYIVMTGNQLPGPPSQMADIDGHIDETVAKLDAVKANSTSAGHSERLSTQSQAEQPAVGINDLDLSALDQERATRLRTVILQGTAPGVNGTSRSEAVFYAACEMIRAGVPDAAILKVLLDRRNGISAHVYAQTDPRRAAQRALESALEKQPRPGTSTSKVDRPTLQLRWHGDAPLQPPRWLVRNRVPETGVGLLVGEWGTHKTFLALDLSAHVMLGWDWTGEPVYRRAGVLCFAPEGAGSIPTRLAALVDHKIKLRLGDLDLFAGGRQKVDHNRLPFAWTSTIPALLGTKKDDPLPVILHAAREAHKHLMEKHGLPLGLILIDTMATAVGFSDENNNAEASTAMAVLRKVSELANADFVLALLGDKKLGGSVSDTRLALRKMREGPAGMEFPFAPKVVDMGKDEKGFPLTSVVLEWNVARVPKERKPPAHQVFDDVLAKAIADHGEAVKSDGHSETRAVRRAHLLTAFKAAYKPDENLSDASKRERFRVALAAAVRSGMVREGTIDGVEYVWYDDTI
jgi:hypothetical protein